MRCMVCTAAEGCEAIRMCTVPLEAMLMSMVLAEGPVDARGPRCQRKLCGSP